MVSIKIDEMRAVRYREECMIFSIFRELIIVHELQVMRKVE